MKLRVQAQHLPTAKVNERQRINIIATFEIPAGEIAYNIFRNMANDKIKRIEKELGADCVLEYLALEIKTVDAIVRD